MKYFAYGLNLNHASMAQRCPQAKPIGKYTLRGWQLAFDGVATVLPDEFKSVQGGLWKITPECEKALDRLEGYPGWYQKVTVKDVMFYTLPIGQWNAPEVHYLTSILIGLDDFRYRHPICTLVENCGFLPPRSKVRTPLTQKNIQVLHRTMKNIGERETPRIEFQ